MAPKLQIVRRPAAAIRAVAPKAKAKSKAKARAVAPKAKAKAKAKVRAVAPNAVGVPLPPQVPQVTCPCCKFAWDGSPLVDDDKYRVVNGKGVVAPDWMLPIPDMFLPRRICLSTKGCQWIWYESNHADLMLGGNLDILTTDAMNTDKISTNLDGTIGWLQYFRRPDGSRARAVLPVPAGQLTIGH